MKPFERDNGTTSFVFCMFHMFFVCAFLFRFVAFLRCVTSAVLYVFLSFLFCLFMFAFPIPLTTWVNDGISRH